MQSVNDLAALIRVPITHETMSNLYRIGAVRPDREAEDLATVLHRLAAAVMIHGISITR